MKYQTRLQPTKVGEGVFVCTIPLTMIQLSKRCIQCRVDCLGTSNAPGCNWPGALPTRMIMTNLYRIFGIHFTLEITRRRIHLIVWRKSGETVIVWNGVERRCNVYDMVREWRNGDKFDYEVTNG